MLFSHCRTSCHTVVTCMLHDDLVMNSMCFDDTTDRQIKWRQQLKKRQQLGLPIGTATHRLRKLMFFRLIQKTGDDRCFRCGLPIESVHDLVMDHKVPWLDNSAELFWDLENIAFSHAGCNSRAVRRDGRCAAALRKVGSSGTAWCSGHRTFLPVRYFQRNRSHWNGLAHCCRECVALDASRRPLRTRNRHRLPRRGWFTSSKALPLFDLNSVSGNHVNQVSGVSFMLDFGALPATFFARTCRAA